jgi:hypothetical protein
MATDEVVELSRTQGLGVDKCPAAGATTATVLVARAAACLAGLLKRSELFVNRRSAEAGRGGEFGGGDDAMLNQRVENLLCGR